MIDGFYSAAFAPLISLPLRVKSSSGLVSPRQLILPLLITCLPLITFAQSPAGRLTNRPALQQKATQWRKEYKHNRDKALQLARKNHWPLQQLLPDGTYISLQGLDEKGQPVYYATDNNARAAATTRTDQLWSGGSLGLNLNGNSPSVTGKLGIWDSGPIRPTHQELKGRVIQKDAGEVVDPGTGSNHATHVAGTLIARGVNPLVKGMAFGTTNLQAYDFSNDLAEMAAAAPNLLVSNHSYGALAGWRLNTSRAGTATDPQWEWLGDASVSKEEDWHFGFYNNDTRRWDEITFNAPYYLPVKSAGNNRSSAGPAVGQPFWRRKTGGGFELVTSRAEGMNSNNAYDIISTYGNAKNILTVGAVNPIPGGANQSTDIRISSFSSWGPTDDGRIKPDIVANGVSVTSSGSTSDDTYVTLNGTSMAAPNVSGTLLLLQEYYASLHNDSFMRAATLKGLVIHTADEAGTGAGPDYQFGWGLLNAEKAARVIANADNSHLLAERSLNQNDVYALPVIASGKGPLVVTLCWTDPPGAAHAVSPANLNNRSPRLVNDLDLRVFEGTQPFSPWTLNPNAPAAAATTGDNVRDNVEQVTIPNPVPGKTYTIRVFHKNTLQNNVQAYSLLASGMGGTAYCAPAAAVQAGSRIEKVTFAGINHTSGTDCATYSDFTRFAASVATGQQVPLSITLSNCSGTGTQVVKVFADWNGNGAFTDTGELAAVSGILSNNAVFTANLTIPSGIVSGNFARLRVVSAETNNAAQVTPCGTGAKGETEDYGLRFTRPANDVGALSLLSPEASLCAGPVTAFTVTLRNYGTQSQNNIPVSVTVQTENGSLAGTFTGTHSAPLPPFAVSRLTIPANLPVEPGRRYTFTIRTGLATDQDATNNTILETREIDGAPRLESAIATICQLDSVQLRASGEGTAFWYDAPSGGKLVAAGNITQTVSKPADKRYYVGLNDFTGSIGPASKSTFGGGSYGGSFGPQPLLTTHVPLVLESARLYIAQAGRITFTLETLSGMALTSTTLEVAPTRNPNLAHGNVSGQWADDPNDPGAVYPLNLAIPAPGSYRITIEYENGASVFRSNTGVSGYPFSIPGVLTIPGAVFNGSTLTDSWYYFYNLKVKALGCSGSRSAVVASTVDAPPPTAALRGGATICAGKDTTLTVTLTGTPPWNLTYARDSTEITLSGITTSPYTFRVSQPGTYRLVSLDDSRSCPVSRLSGSAVISVNSPVAATITVLGSTLTASEGGQKYRWFLNNAPLGRDTTREITAFQSGEYAVEITDANGCTARSPGTTLTGLISHALSSAAISLAPNPTDGKFRLAFSHPTYPIRTIILTDVLGRRVKSWEGLVLNPDGEIQFDCRELPGGIYLMQIIAGEETATVRLVKQ